eukprot:TRINITY_DN15959_c0_g1_i1.p1 TRINITY_DN15959_c0_g1~~TRINITY_DN15959_c0_g1_i1.p1  ORF type:complete len:402 (+),score=100.35 TRINITY_DN15959_c0_g1_i1:20-1225(+)
MSGKGRGKGRREESSSESEEIVVRGEEEVSLAEYITGVTHGLDDEVQALFERRTDVKEIALGKLIEGAQKAYCYDLIKGNTQDILKALKSCISSPCSNLEQTRACHLLQLAALTCSEEWSVYYAELSTLLKKSIGNSTAQEQKVASIITLGLITFLWAEGEETVEVVQFLSDALVAAEEREEDEDLSDAATLKAWSLLITTLSAEYVVDDLIPSFLNNIVGFLGRSDPDLKLAAAETLALLIENVKSIEGDSYEPYYFNGYFDVSEILLDLKDLANANPRVVSKKLKNKFKPVEDVVTTFESGSSPVSNLVFKGQKFTFNSWYESQRLDYLRAILSIGFQHHFLHNNLLRNIFDVIIKEDAPSFSGSEKRASKIENSRISKFRHNQIKKGRRNKQHVQDEF